MSMATSSLFCMNSLAPAFTGEDATQRLMAGDLAGARSLAEALISSNPEDFGALHVLGLVEARADRFEIAVSLLERVVDLNPADAAPWRNLGLIHIASGNWVDARRVLRRGMQHHGNDARLQNLLGRATLEAGSFEESLSAYHRAYELDSDRESAIGVAKALRALRRYHDAAAVVEAVVENEPDYAAGHAFLADLYALDGRLDAVLQHRAEAFRLSPDSDEARARLAATTWDNGDLCRSLKLAQPLVEAGRVSPALHSFYLSGLLHHHEQNINDVRQAHERWGSLHTCNIRANTTWPVEFAPERRLRVAYMGGDFYDNPSLHFLVPFFRHHNRRDFEVFGYDLRCRDDRGTTQFREHSDHWRACRQLSDRQILELIGEDQIDILVDTTGHYAGNRLHLLAFHPAPVQVAMLNYPATTGLSCFDGIVTDPWVCPEGMEHQYTESALRLPSGYLPYAVPENLPEVTPLPALRNGYVTFGLFQRPVKISPSCWQAIATVMDRTPGSRLLVHNAFPQLTSPDSFMRDLYTRELESRGIDRSRVGFAGPAGWHEHMRFVAEADVALDTFPYSGQTTTCECLWTGVPVITLVGECHVARVGQSILCRAGIPEWCTESTPRYIETASALAADLGSLASIRGSLRERIAASVLVDGRQVTRELEDSLRALWRKRCLQKEN
jgi:predicted O-linked N-acetylglucosamine transferase (SPINDLY family)